MPYIDGTAIYFLELDDHDRDEARLRRLRPDLFEEEEEHIDEDNN
jgi:hypothetical protein